MSKLAVIAAFFNPSNYVSTRYNYLKFSQSIKKCCDLFPIELSFNGDFFIDDANSVRLLGDDSNILWQKERLFNIRLSSVPKDYTNIAWIDCDVLFLNPSWVMEANSKLEEYKVVQLFENVLRTDSDGSIARTSKSFIKHMVESGKVDENFSGGIPGFAWAARRDVIEKVGFLDIQIVGGADGCMMYSFLGRHKDNRLLPNGSLGCSLGWRSAMESWGNKAFKEVNGEVGYVSGDILHLYHGSRKCRKYKSRTLILTQKGFDPNIDLTVEENGIYKVHPRFRQDLLHYFNGRDEDDGLRHRSVS